MKKEGASADEFAMMQSAFGDQIKAAVEAKKKEDAKDSAAKAKAPAGPTPAQIKKEEDEKKAKILKEK